MFAYPIVLKKSQDQGLVCRVLCCFSIISITPSQPWNWSMWCVILQLWRITWWWSTTLLSAVLLNYSRWQGIWSDSALICFSGMQMHIIPWDHSYTSLCMSRSSCRYTFSASTLLVWWHEKHLAHKNSHQQSPKVTHLCMPCRRFNVVHVTWVIMSGRPLGIQSNFE